MAEKIIIDGVNVRKCKHFKAWYESRPNGFGGITIENYCYLYKDNCEKYPQCLYRSNQLQQLETQLKHKEQECESQKQRLEYYIEKTTQLLDDIDNKDRFITKLQEQLNNIQDNCPCFEDCCYRQCDKDRIDKYERIVDEIEKFINNQLDNFGNDVYSMDKSAINNIQDIINNVKEK